MSPFVCTVQLPSLNFSFCYCSMMVEMETEHWIFLFSAIVLFRTYIYTYEFMMIIFLAHSKVRAFCETPRKFHCLLRTLSPFCLYHSAIVSFSFCYCSTMVEMEAEHWIFSLLYSSFVCTFKGASFMWNSVSWRLPVFGFCHWPFLFSSPPWSGRGRIFPCHGNCLCRSHCVCVCVDCGGGLFEKSCSEFCGRPVDFPWHFSASTWSFIWFSNPLPKGGGPPPRRCHLPRPEAEDYYSVPSAFSCICLLPSGMRHCWWGWGQSLLFLWQTLLSVYCRLPLLALVPRVPQYPASMCRF